jgi:hypothetical protein
MPAPGPIASATRAGDPAGVPAVPAPGGPVPAPATVAPARAEPLGLPSLDLPAPGPPAVSLPEAVGRGHAASRRPVGEPDPVVAPVAPVHPAPALPPGRGVPVVRPAPPGHVPEHGPAASPVSAPGSRRDPLVGSPLARPRPAAPVSPDEVRRIVVRELARTAAPPAAALPLPVPAAAAPPVAAPAPPVPRFDAPTVRADRAAEHPRRAGPPVDVGRITDAVTRRMARRGAVEGERRGMNR